MPDDVLTRYRKSIDNIDSALVCLLAERFKITQAVGEHKAHAGLPPPIRAARTRRSRGCGGWPRRPSWTPNSARSSCASSSTR